MLTTCRPSWDDCSLRLNHVTLVKTSIKKSIYMPIACALPKHIGLYLPESKITSSILALCGHKITVKWLISATADAFLLRCCHHAVNRSMFVVSQKPAICYWQLTAKKSITAPARWFEPIPARDVWHIRLKNTECKSVVYSEPLYRI